MAGAPTGRINDVGKALSEKAPTSIKEVVKVISELATKLDAFAVDIKLQVGSIEGSNSEIKGEVGKMREYLEFMNVAFEGFKNDIANFRRELTEVKTQNKEIVKQNQEMSRQLADAEKEIIELQQHGRNMNVEIMGLPRTADENLKATVGIMATCLGIELSDGDVDVAHRVPSRDKDKSNVVGTDELHPRRDLLLSLDGHLES
ncbi:hypothetical protein HPB50_022409 [Hyalomma asiaticum]|uniref:Uncharacterized protein n=1 Tax=Hyalomma asiaticum TaxID=266040 RepID=A0ACB7S8E8_HYAAI|nr:hypothetical protein HPB50_022409 [Hyalomma asiaticum]